VTFPWLRLFVGGYRSGVQYHDKHHNARWLWADYGGSLSSYSNAHTLAHTVTSEHTPASVSLEKETETETETVTETETETETEIEQETETETEKEIPLQPHLCVFRAPLSALKRAKLVSARGQYVNLNCI